MSEQVEETSNPRCWKKAGWIARVVKNENDDGWAVEMTRIGESEPSLVSPWTMGRDKVNPKPLDHAGFATLVKGATEVMARHAQAARARLHRSIHCQSDTGARLHVTLDIQEDEDDPHAILVVIDEQTGDTLRSGRTSAGFKLNEKAVRQFLRTGEG
ncbi:MAG TPA: hypothetical protein VHW23_21485 [Kofleriaceae bacterium]|jgi:hypothetical protein|nr:hypothetical protein [Kofleriaceae bacterium]